MSLLHSITRLMQIIHILLLCDDAQLAKGLLNVKM